MQGMRTAIARLLHLKSCSNWTLFVTLISCTLLAIIIFILGDLNDHVAKSKEWKITDEPAGPPPFAVIEARLSETSTPLFVNFSKFVIWSANYHHSLIQDLKNLVGGQGVQVIAHNFASNCWMTRSCSKGLQGMSRDSAMRPTTAMKKKFYQIHSGQLNHVDAFLCYFPAAICEYFQPFHKTMIVVFSQRYELGREKSLDWINWNNNLLQIASSSRNVLIANNLYDMKYIEYFTGLTPLFIPSYCGYTNKRYDPTTSTFLLFPLKNNDFEIKFITDFIRTCGKMENCSTVMRPMRSLYKGNSFANLASHPGIVHVPHQVITTSFAEQYTMGIPLFTPSLELLTAWHMRHNVVTERTLAASRGTRPGNSRFHRNISYTDMPDPNNDRSAVAVKRWLQYAEVYRRPHVILFDSIKDLIFKMNTVNLTMVSEQMLRYTEEVREEAFVKWRRVLSCSAKFNPKYMYSHRRP